MGRLEATLAAIDEYNAADPNRERCDGADIAKELLYSQRMSAQLGELEPDASEALQIAVRAQHIGRWEIARSEYPQGRTGYKKWRSELAQRHADVTARLMSRAGYEGAAVERVRTLLRKQGLRSDAEVQTLEDCACLVFIRFYLRDFAGKHDREKIVDIIGKTWKKMSKRAHQSALELAIDDELRELVAAAIG